MIKLLGYFAELERWIVRKDEVFHPELIMRLHYTRSLFILFRFEPLLMETPFRFRPAWNDICFHLEQSTTSFNQRNRTELSISGSERNVSLEYHHYSSNRTACLFASTFCAEFQETLLY